MSDPIEESLKRADLRPDEGGPSQGTMQEQRREFQRSDVPRPDSGPTMMERLASRFRAGSTRPDSRTDTRR